MPKAFSTPSLVALNITSQELGRGGAFLPPPTKVVLSNSPTTIGLKHFASYFIGWCFSSKNSLSQAFWPFHFGEDNKIG